MSDNPYAPPQSVDDLQLPSTNHSRAELTALSSFSRIMFALGSVSGMIIAVVTLLEEAQMFLQAVICVFAAISSAKLAITGVTDSPIIRFTKLGRRGTQGISGIHGKTTKHPDY